MMLGLNTGAAKNDQPPASYDLAIPGPFASPSEMVHPCIMMRRDSHGIEKSYHIAGEISVVMVGVL